MDTQTGDSRQTAGVDPDRLAATVATLRQRVGELARYLDRLGPPAADEAVVPLTHLLDVAAMAEVLARYHRSWPKSDRSAAVSMWSQYLFATLIMPAALVRLVGAMPLPEGLEAQSLRLALGSAEPRGIVFTPSRDAGAGPAAFGEGWAAAVLAPLVATIGAAGGIGERILWSNAAVILANAVDEVTALGAGEGAAPAAALLDTLVRSDGRRNPVYRPYRASAHGPVRRVCCLRHDLVGVERCTTCPSLFLQPQPPPAAA